MKRIYCFMALLALGSLAFAQPDKAEQAKLDKLQKVYTQAKAAAAKAKPGSAKSKSYVEATVAYGNCVMMSPILKPKDKYPKALNLFREALKVDPKQKVALENKTMIEKIYTDMGRPIPKG